MGTKRLLFLFFLASGYLGGYIRCCSTEAAVAARRGFQKKGRYMETNPKLTFAILGGGGRGNAYADWLKNHPDAGKVVAVAEPDPARRAKIAQMHAIPADMQFDDWRALLARPRLADAVFLALMDRLHAPAGLLALNLGYHMLLEKPMATTLEDCVALERAARENKRIVGVCHQMRYHRIYTELKRLLTDGALGRLISFDHIEYVEHLHQSHSFVRGNWGNQARSTFMLLAKCCHDVDNLMWLVGQPCRRVSSFGSLSYFTAENAPSGAPARCTDGCPAEAQCPYSAYKLYIHENPHWFQDHAGLTGKSYEERLQAARTGPYGRCVFRADNDVVDHQVVAFEFDGGITGTFTMTAFTPKGGRYFRFHGTHGFIQGSMDDNTLDVYRLADRKHDHIVLPPLAGSHGGGDDLVMHNFIRALRTKDPAVILASPAESLASHKIVFAAERARLEKRVVALTEMD